MFFPVITKNSNWEISKDKMGLKGWKTLGFMEKAEF